MTEAAPPSPEPGASSPSRALDAEPPAPDAASRALDAALPAPDPAPPAGPRGPRIESVDLLRGLIMVLMALDHVRDHIHRGAMQFDPTDLTRAGPALFMTRWITHFCAPVFVFLAGTGAFLWGARGRTKGEISRYLLTRGLWLVLLELTLVNWEWSMGVQFNHFGALVIWALGWSLVALAGLVYLPVAAIAGIGWVMILGHNALDGVKPESWGALAWLWRVLHVQGDIHLGPGRTIFVMYPLIPWIGVMAAGYAFGGLLARPPEARRRTVLALGAAMTAAFVALRAINLYGDPMRWSVQHDGLTTALSFLNCQKYPPSLLFLLMTLGLALLLLGATDRGFAAAARPLVVFGRVPLFYYLIHLALIDAVTVALAIARYGSRVGQMMANGPPPGYGYRLPVVYAVWIGVIVVLYPFCRWYAQVKARSRSRWLSYL